MSGVARVKRLYLHITLIASLLYILVARYAGSNDLSVYADAIASGGIYSGDFAFEFLQVIALKLVGSGKVLEFLQVFLLFLSLLYIVMLSRRIKDGMLPVAFLILTSPMIIVGLTNSIRQSFCFVIALIAFECRSVLRQFLFLLISVAFHKVALILIVLLFAERFSLASALTHFRRTPAALRLFVALSGGIVVVLSMGYILGLLSTIFSRYSVYLYSAELFTEGRVGEVKILVWISFWLVLIVIETAVRKGVFSVSFIAVPLVFTIFVLIDALVRGFDEFHSRLLMLNYVLAIAWLVELSKRRKCNMLVYLVFVVFNLLNPSTLGVIL